MDPRSRDRRRLLAALGAAAALPLARASASGGPPPRVADDVATALDALDPDRIGADAVRDVLARAPAPHVALLQGSVPIVTMEPFGEFLAGMGYPADRLRDPRTGRMTASSYTDSATLAGALAWHYERDGVRPLVIGHSQGGMLAVRTLHELAGAFAERVEVVDALTGDGTGRFAIRDPLSGEERPVVGLALPYATALATGRLFRVLLGQWAMLERLYRIPDTVDAFTGFSIPGDALAWGERPYAAIGRAQVRNVVLPASYSHIGLPLAAHLAADPRARDWVERYVPGTTPPPAPDAGFDTTNAIHAADVWHSVKRHWCLEAQRLAAAERARR